MKEIPLTQGKVALVDDEDYEYLMQWKWFYNNGYAARHVIKPGTRNCTRIIMHRIIAQTPDGMDTDHINLNRLDNRRSNLRNATRSQNKMNIDKPCRRSSTSRYKGVSWHAKKGKWRSVIRIDGKSTHIGFFTDEIEAAKAYDVKALELFGEFARPNFPLSKVNQ